MLLEFCTLLITCIPLVKSIRLNQHFVCATVCVFVIVAAFRGLERVYEFRFRFLTKPKAAVRRKEVWDGGQNRRRSGGRESPSGVQGRSRRRGSEGQSPPEAEEF